MTVRLGAGHLAFENDKSEEQVVDSHALGQALATCKVPLFVLNACQSAQEGKDDAFSSVASQLVAIGAKAVVAMSYTVYASAAGLFMERFYEALAGHATVADAVAIGRRALHARPDRESVAGVLELRDWLVPALYQQEHGYVPFPAVPADDRQTAAAASHAAVRPPTRPAAEVCPEGQFGFIGRDYDLLRIERALRDDRAPWVLLSGIGGTGKTELAFGFARWYAETGGCAGSVYATSFRQSASFGQVVGSIVGYATDLSQRPEQEQIDTIVRYLRVNPCLLVWDNFETVAGYPEGATPLAEATDRDAIAGFVQALRGGKTRVGITTRSPGEILAGSGIRTGRGDWPRSTRHARPRSSYPEDGGANPRKLPRRPGHRSTSVVVKGPPTLAAGRLAPSTWEVAGWFRFSSIAWRAPKIYLT